jgi:hypothetical protein
MTIIAIGKLAEIIFGLTMIGLLAKIIYNTTKGKEFGIILTLIAAIITLVSIAIMSIAVAFLIGGVINVI